jgi:hypothetical protein
LACSSVLAGGEGIKRALAAAGAEGVVDGLAGGDEPEGATDGNGADEGDGDRTDSLPNLALLLIVASLILKITYRGRIQAEAVAAAKVEEAMVMEPAK